MKSSALLPVLVLLVVACAVPNDPPGDEHYFATPTPSAKAAYIRVEIFDDQDGDGARDPTEPDLAWASACVSPDVIGNSHCRAADADGSVTFGPYPAGRYQIFGPARLEPYTEPDLTDQEITIEIVNSGVELISMPVDVVTVDEQIIHPGEGQPVDYSVCSHNPMWIGDAEGEAEALAALDYRPIDGPLLTFDRDVGSPWPGFPWADIIDLPAPALASCPPRDDFDQSRTVLAMRSLSPVDVLRRGNVLQVRVVEALAGYTLIVVPTESDPEQLHNVLFVTEELTPLYRCTSLTCLGVQSRDQLR